MLDDAIGVTVLDEASFGVANRIWQMTTDSRSPLILGGGGCEEEEGMGSAGVSAGR